MRTPSYLPDTNGGAVLSRLCRIVIATLDKRSSFSQSNMDPVAKRRSTPSQLIREVQDVDEARRFNCHVIDRPA